MISLLSTNPIMSLNTVLGLSCSFCSAGLLTTLMCLYIFTLGSSVWLFCLSGITKHLLQIFVRCLFTKDCSVDHITSNFYLNDITSLYPPLLVPFPIGFINSEITTQFNYMSTFFYCLSPFPNLHRM